MMKTKKTVWFFIIITILALTFFYIEDHLKSPEKTPYYKEKLMAAKLAALAMDSLKAEAMRRNIPTDSINDPYRTYLIGNKFSIITVKQNQLRDVLTTLNPNFASGIVEMLKKLKLKEGDIIAINTSGSFPGLNIALLSACEVLKLKPVITTGVASASYGANIPEFTYLDMETFLKKRGLFHNSTTAASLGGEKDNGEGLSPEGRKLLVDIINRNNIKLINTGSLAGNIEQRDNIYKDFSEKNRKKLKVFIDVGGTVTGFGQTIKDTLIKPGLNPYPENKFLSNYGLIHRVTEERIPFIFLGDIPHLVKLMELPLAPVPLPHPGEGALFYKERYSVKLAIVFVLFLLVLLFKYIRLEIFLKRNEVTK